MLSSFFLTAYHLIFGFSKSKFFLWVSFIILFLLLGFRDISVGTDTVVYANMFAEYHDGLYFNLVEPGWVFLNKSIDFLGGDFNTVLWFTAIIILLPVFYGVGKYSDYPLLSIFIYITFYYYFYSFNIMRQSIAQGFVFLSFCFFNMEKSVIKQNKSFFISFIIAFLFHYTSIVYLLFIGIFYFIKNNTYKTYAVLFISFFIGIGFNSIILKGTTLFLTAYANEEVSENFLSGLINLLVLNLAFIFISSFVKNKDKWYYGFFMFISISNIMNGITIGNRIVMFAGMFLIIFFAGLFNNLRLHKKWNLILFIFIVAYSYFRFFRLLGSGDIFPYENILLNIKIEE